MQRRMSYSDASLVPTTMKRLLPPLVSLRAFEAVARHMSFTLAADELCVTQSAVSRHIRNLESHYGVKLFNRLTRAIECTAEGARLFAVVTGAFAQIEAVEEELTGRPTSRQLLVSILPTLASSWLMPRLVNFTQTHQHIEIRLITSIEAVSFSRDKIDVAIRVGKPPGKRARPGAPRIDLVMTDEWRGVAVEPLFPDVLVPICKPELIKGRLPVSPATLTRLPLIHTDSRLRAWTDWFAAQDIAYERKPDALHFGHFFMSMRAALEGRGVALVPDVLVADDVASGNLIVPVRERVQSGGEYCLLYRKERAEDDAIAAFRQWVHAEVAAMAR